jgi:transcriptional regulator with XRE-family HTH domain
MSKAKSTSAARAAKGKSDRAKEPNFGGAIRSRRRELDLTQDAVASLIKTSNTYVAHLESDKRHPSDEVVRRLAEVLGLDYRDLFSLANPQTLLSAQPERAEGSVSAWEQLRTNEQLRRIHDVSNDEMEMLSRVALLGEIQSPRDLMFILMTVRHAVGR